MPLNRCDTCKKRGIKALRPFAEDGCNLLTYRLGEVKDCPFWGDDVEWARKAEKKTASYARKHGKVWPEVEDDSPIEG